MTNFFPISQLKLNMTVAAKFTLNDYHRMIEAGILSFRQVELIDGIIIEMPPESPEHSSYSGNLADKLRDLLLDRALVREGKSITLLTSNTEPQPDIAIVVQPRSLYLQQHPYPEHIYFLVEVSRSTIAFDTGDGATDKPKIYASAGINEYWVVDINSRKLIVYRSPVNDEYQQKTEYLYGDKISPLAFPDIEIAIADIFLLA
ncbi:MAG: Uma2 family endonuclease [Hydrococcus sp. Prado102]|jgi:Uma2 family endonuclease|nr:Uma2 family endonuclease [Hydrococcus sp. Prado102]